jgi:hypothetical protein
MQHYDTIDKQTVNGFDIVCSTTYEDTHPRDLFDDTVDDIGEMCRKIDLGLLDWFVVRVQAYKEGVLLGEAYLGGNLYDNRQDFVTESGGYYQDLMGEAINEAKSKLDRLLATV